MKIPPTFLKWLGAVLILSSIIGWPITSMTIAKEEPFVILSLSWLALVFSGLAFYSSAQDGVDIDEILDILKKK